MLPKEKMPELISEFANLIAIEIELKRQSELKRFLTPKDRKELLQEQICKETISNILNIFPEDELLLFFKTMLENIFEKPSAASLTYKRLISKIKQTISY